MEFFSLDIPLIPCLTKHLLGIECPGCGLQRSLIALFAGDIRKSFELYPPVFLIISTFAVLIANLLMEFRYRLTILITLYIATLISILINYILKFIP